jgi:DNA invertase Pin-like site-specific DNA recombinase
MMKALVYIRSARADTSGQMAAIEDYCERRGLAIDACHVDTHTSGNTPLAARASGKRLLDQLKHGDQVVVDDLARLARDLGALNSILDEFARLGVRLHACKAPPAQAE